MGYRYHIQKQSSHSSTFTPTKDPFAPRPFANGVQPRSAKLPTTDLLKPHPFAPRIEPPQEMPDLQTRLEMAQRVGYNAANIPVFAPDTRGVIGVDYSYQNT